MFKFILGNNNPAPENMISRILPQIRRDVTKYPAGQLTIVTLDYRRRAGIPPQHPKMINRDARSSTSVVHMSQPFLQVRTIFDCSLTLCLESFSISSRHLLATVQQRLPVWKVLSSNFTKSLARFCNRTNTTRAHAPP